MRIVLRQHSALSGFFHQDAFRDPHQFRYISQRTHTLLIQSKGALKATLFQTQAQHFQECGMIL